MNLHCRYHPTRTPVLMCGQCSVTVCPDCIPNWPARGYPRCVSCRSEMEPLSISEYVKPFWQCFDQFFKFPFKASNLKFIFFTFLFFLIVPLYDAKEYVNPLEAIYSIVMWIIFPSFIVAYMSAVAIKASDGNPAPPEISESWKDGGFLILFKAVVIVLIFRSLLASTLIFMGGAVASILSMLIALAFPATLMLLFLERKISVAIHPGKVVGIIQAIGWPYMFLWGLVMILIAGPETLMSLSGEGIHLKILPTLALLSSLYFGLVLFHLLGYVVYQYHYELGVSLPSEELEGLRKSISPQKAILKESELLVMDGKYHSAIDLLQRFILQNPDQESKQDQLWLKLFEISQIVCKQKQSIEITEDYIHYLLTRNQNFKVVAILRSLLQKTPQFKFCDFSSPDSIEKFLRDEKEVELLIQLI